MPLSKIYELYCSYIDALHKDLKRLQISEKYWAKKLSFAEFEIVWTNLSEAEKKTRADEFVTGYKKTAQRDRDRLAEAFRKNRETKTRLAQERIS